MSLRSQAIKGDRRGNVGRSVSPIGGALRRPVATIEPTTRGRRHRAAPLAASARNAVSPPHRRGSPLLDDRHTGGAGTDLADVDRGSIQIAARESARLGTRWSCTASAKVMSRSSTGPCSSGRKIRGGPLRPARGRLTSVYLSLVLNVRTPSTRSCAIQGSHAGVTSPAAFCSISAA